MTSWTPGGKPPESPYGQQDGSGPGSPSSPGSGGSFGPSSAGTAVPPQYGAGPQWGAPQQPYGHSAGASQWSAPPQQPYGGYPSAPPVGGLPQPGVGGRGFASMGNRLIARIIDALIVGIPMGIIIGIVVAVAVKSSTLTYDPTTGNYYYTAGSGAGIALAFEILAVLVAIAYEVYFIGAKGATIGKKVMGVRVQDAETGQPIGYGRGFVRYLVLAVTGSICFIGYLSPFFDSTKRNQGWHDKAANDLVVSTK